VSATLRRAQAEVEKLALKRDLDFRHQGTPEQAYLKWMWWQKWTRRVLIVVPCLILMCLIVLAALYHLD
jgi:hypothetical protein